MAPSHRTVAVKEATSGLCNAYSVYSSKEKESQNWLCSDGQDATQWTLKSFVCNLQTAFQAVGCEFDSRLPLHLIHIHPECGRLPDHLRGQVNHPGRDLHS